MKKKLGEEIRQKRIGEVGTNSPNVFKPRAEDVDENDLDDICKKHLIFSKVIRDSVHGDIWLTKLETEIIDTPIFQRLRRIKQLGPTDLVYPSAKHTRFDHSIGALFVAQQIIDSINKNFDNGLSYYKISSRDIITIRILALIHDLAHLPYGHTIEDEGGLFNKKQWRDTERFDYIWRIIQQIIKSQLDNLPSIEREKIIQDLNRGLKAEEGDKDNNIHELERPFIVDIVGNTICADLLDYLKRDAYNTGLKMVYDPRVLSYFVLVKQTKEIEEKTAKGILEVKSIEGIRAAILLEKKEGKIKYDILNYCVDLLRMRYSLAEKSYFHRVKCIASAMVIKMIYCALEGKIIFNLVNAKSEEEKKFTLISLGDDSLIFTIMSYDNKDNQSDYTKTAKKLASKLFNRDLYKEIYSKNYTDESTYDSLVKFADKKERYKKERELEDLCKLEPGSIVIYCPEKQSGKVAETKMLRYNKTGDKIVKTLKELSMEENYCSTIGQELTTIDNLYKRLWNFYILVDKKCIKDERHEQYLKKACLEFIEKNGISNDAVMLIDYILDGNLTQKQIFDVASELALAKDAREVRDKIGFIDRKILSFKGSGK